MRAPTVVYVNRRRETTAPASTPQWQPHGALRSATRRAAASRAIGVM